MKLIHLFALLVLLTMACNKNECVTCENGQFSEEVCENDEITYTDANGQPIGDYDAYVAFLEAAGYECK